PRWCRRAARPWWSSRPTCRATSSWWTTASSAPSTRARWASSRSRARSVRRSTPDSSTTSSTPKASPREAGKDAMERLLPLMLAAILAPATAGAMDATDAPAQYRAIDGGPFRSSVRFEEAAAAATMPVASFQLMERPVSNAQYAAFLATHPNWRRDRIPAVFASPGYLGHWASAD